MGLKRGSVKGLVGVGRGLEEDIGGYIYHLKSIVGVGKEESQLISEFADCPFS